MRRLRAEVLTKAGNKIMYYVYVIESEKYPDEHYTGFTENVPQRIDDHNKGKSVHTSKYKPWKLIVFVAFNDEIQAKQFEFYLKTGSGRAFLKRHFLLKTV